MPDVIVALRAWAEGIHPLQAGVELLIRHGKAIYAAAPWIGYDGQDVWLKVDELASASGAWSGGERRIVDIALSLIDPSRQVNLHDAITGLDDRGTALVLAAISHAADQHLHPWPP